MILRYCQQKYVVLDFYLGYGTTYSVRWLPLFQKNLLPLCLGYKSLVAVPPRTLINRLPNHSVISNKGIF